MRMMKRWLRRGLILPAAAVCALSVSISAAQAALVTYSFTGSVDNIAPKDTISGLFQFDNATGGSGGVYNGAVTGFTLKIEGFGHNSFFAPGANAVTISQNMPLGGGIVDRWALVTAATGEAISGTTTRPFSFDLRLDHNGGGLFTDLNLQGPPSLSSLNGGRAQWRLFFEDVNGNPSVYLGSISSLTAVPLPAAVLLFGAGLISLVGLGAGGLRNLRASKA